MSDPQRQPRIQLSLSIGEAIALCCMRGMGKMFTKPVHRDQVDKVLARIEKRLTALGVPPDKVTRLLSIPR